MSLLSPPQIPLFRITLFYGPEAIEGASDTVHCVFNVKKRSWKGGVQVGVLIERNQIRRLEKKLAFLSWLEEQLLMMPSNTRENHIKLGYDLFIQFICFHKLETFIRQGIKQENVQVSAGFLILETDEAIQREAEKIKQQIMVELDVEEFKKGIEPTSA